MTFKKNTAVTGFTVGFVSATDGTAVTTGTPVIYYTLDGGSQGTVSGSMVHEGNGQWSVDLLAAEMNGDVVGLLFTLSGAIPVQHTIRTDTKILSDLADFDPDVDTVDGLTFTKAIQALMAAGFNVATVSGNTVSFKARDGSTEVVSVTVDASTAGKRDTSTVT